MAERIQTTRICAIKVSMWGLFLEPQPWEESFLVAHQGQPDQDSLHAKDTAPWRSWMSPGACTSSCSLQLPSLGVTHFQKACREASSHAWILLGSSLLWYIPMYLCSQANVIIRILPLPRNSFLKRMQEIILIFFIPSTFSVLWWLINWLLLYNNHLFQFNHSINFF